MKDIIGETFGRLIVLEKARKNNRNGFLCKCLCGNITFASGHQLRSGAKKSCGCLQREVGKINFTKHGESNSRLYEVWVGMKKRCYNSNSPAYKNYGGRGITVCDEWKDNYTAFRDFMLGLGYDDSLPFRSQTLERINVNGNYEPNNCKLVSMKEQNVNRRNNHYVTYKGETKTITEIANEHGLEVENLLNRINYFGYTIEEAVEKPVRNYPRRKAPEYEVDGESLTLREWAERFGMTRGQFKSKTRRKTVEEVVRQLKKEKNG